MTLPTNFNPVMGARLIYKGMHNGETNVEFTVTCSCPHKFPTYFRRSEIKKNPSMYALPKDKDNGS